MSAATREARAAHQLIAREGEAVALHDPAGGEWQGRAVVERDPAALPGMVAEGYEIAPTAMVTVAAYGARAPAPGALLIDRVGHRWRVDRAERDRGLYTLTLRDDAP